MFRPIFKLNTAMIKSIYVNDFNCFIDPFDVSCSNHYHTWPPTAPLAAVKSCQKHSTDHETLKWITALYHICS